MRGGQLSWQFYRITATRLVVCATSEQQLYSVTFTLSVVYVNNVLN